MKKRILSLLLAVLMVSALLPVTVLAQWEGWSALQTGGALSNGKKYYLAGDKTLTKNITLSSGNATLDLNGYVLKGTGSGSVITVSGGTLTIQDSNPKGTHTGTYSSLPAGGCITGGTGTGGNALGDGGGGIRIYNGGKVIMSGGNIAGNTITAGNGGGVHITGSGSSFTMTGGSITGNSAPTRGGGLIICDTATVSITNAKITNNILTGGNNNNNGSGIYTCGLQASSGDNGNTEANRPTVTLSNVEVSGNTGANYGGGIFIKSGIVNAENCSITGNNAKNGGGGVEIESILSTFNMTGGSVTGNTVTAPEGNMHKGGGVHFNKGYFNVKGTVNITDNTCDSVASNVYIRNNPTDIKFNIGDMSTDSAIGVYAAAAEVNSADSVTVTTNCSINQKECFLSDNTKYVVKYDTDHLTLVKGYAITNNTPESNKINQNGFITVAPSAYSGETVTLTVTPVEGYQLKADSLLVTYNDGTDKTITPAATLTAGQYTFQMPAYAVTVKAEFAKSVGYKVEHIACMFDGNIGEPTNEADAANGAIVLETETLTGTPGAEVEAAAIELPKGYIAVDESKKSAVVADDGSTVIKFYYTRENHKLRVDENYEGAVPDEIEYAFGQPITLPSDPEREGYTFAGWCKDADCAESWGDTIPAEMGTEDICLYAAWEINIHDVVYNYDVETNINGVFERMTETDSCAYNEEIYLWENDMEGFEFDGWYTDEELTEKFEEGTIMPDETFNLYGRYTRIKSEPENTYSLTLSGKIGTNIYLDLDAYAAENLNVKITYNASNTVYKTSYTAKTLSKSDFAPANSRYVYTIWQAPAQIAEDITVEIYDGDTLLDTMPVNGKTYADAVMNGDYDAKLKALAQALVVYADEAAKYFNYAAVSSQPDYAVITSEDGDIYNTTLTGIDMSNVAPFSFSDGSVRGITFMSLDESALRVYYSADCKITNASLTTPTGTNWKVTVNSEKNYVEVAGIEGANLGKSFIVETNVGTFTASALSYAKAAYTGDTANFCGALYNYAQAAAAYFA